jgi:hypothetical protein
MSGLRGGDELDKLDELDELDGRAAVSRLEFFGRELL